MSVVEKLKISAEQYEKNAERNRDRAREERELAEGHDRAAIEDDAMAVEYRRAAEQLMEPRTGGATQESSEMPAVSELSLGSCVGTSLHHDSAYQDQHLRNQALDYASRSGGYRGEIIIAAESYYAFLIGNCPPKAG